MESAAPAARRPRPGGAVTTRLRSGTDPWVQVGLDRQANAAHPVHKHAQPLVQGADRETGRRYRFLVATFLTGNALGTLRAM